MRKLDSTTFHAAVNEGGMLLCLFEEGSPSSNNGSQVTALTELANRFCATLARVDTLRSPDIAPLFGVQNEWPVLLLMRDKIVLYFESISGRPACDLQSIVQQAANLDMDRIRQEIQTEQQSVAHLFGRNVCPMSKRSR